jgi:hypothetical protein
MLSESRLVADDRASNETINFTKQPSLADETSPIRVRARILMLLYFNNSLNSKNVAPIEVAQP